MIIFNRIVSNLQIPSLDVFLSSDHRFNLKFNEALSSPLLKCQLEKDPEYVQGRARAHGQARSHLLICGAALLWGAGALGQAK